MSNPPPGPSQPRPDEPKAVWRAWARGRPGRVELPEGAIDDLVGAEGWVVTWRPLPDEPDPTGLEVGFQGRLALTRTPEAGGLTVHPADSPLERHRFGFEQPAAGAPTVPLDEIVAILVPGMAFDRTGIRLGRGAGHFDRFLAGLTGVALVGVCAEARIVDRLPREPHDIPMTHLLSEAGLYRIPPPRSAPPEANNPAGGSHQHEGGRSAASDNPAREL